MKEIIANKDLEKLCEITMKDSNNFHAVCRDSFPSINYMNDTSNFIQKCVNQINSKSGKTIVNIINIVWLYF